MIQITETRDYRLLAEMNEEVQTLHHELYPKVFKPYDNGRIIDFFKDTLEKDFVKAYIALKDGVAVGYVVVFIRSSADNPFQYQRRYLLLDHLLVLKKCRGAGVGKLLIEEVFSFARSLGITTVELNHWTLNETARIFFKKNGFSYFNEKMSVEL